MLSLDHARSSISTTSSSLEEDEISIDSNEGHSTMEADVVEIDFVLGTRGDMRLLSRAKKRRLRVNRRNCKHKTMSNRRSRKIEAQQLMEQKIIQVRKFIGNFLGNDWRSLLRWGPEELN